MTGASSRNDFNTFMAAYDKDRKAREKTNLANQYAIIDALDQAGKPACAEGAEAIINCQQFSASAESQENINEVCHYWFRQNWYCARTCLCAERHRSRDCKLTWT